MPEIILPTLHKGQQEAFWTPGRNKVIRCGRRWGKSVFGGVWVADGAAKGMRCGWFTPDYRIMKEAWREVKSILDPIILRSSETDKIMETVTGGIIEFWTLENDLAGRSRKYHRIVLDEIAFAKQNVEQIWEMSIAPTLLDFRGRALALSTPNGDNEENFFWRMCHDPKLGFVEYHAPSWTNPHLPSDEIERLRRDKPPLIFQQEYAAEFIDWKSSSYFKLEDMLETGRPVENPEKPDGIFAVLDTTAKGGDGNDGTAVIIYAFQREPRESKCWVLDWDIVEIEAGLLDQWVPAIFQRCEEYAKLTGALYGFRGVFVEDKAAGIVLLQQGKRRGWPVIPIDSKLTSLGKDARAMNASGYIHLGKVKITQHAYDKTCVFKQKSKNHFLTQVFGFRLNDPDAARREDDLLDCLTYGAALAFGNNEGF